VPQFNSTSDVKVIIHAANVHGGGGKVLLMPLLEFLGPEEIALVDKRLELSSELESRIKIKRISPTLVGRFYAELILLFAVKKSNIVLCFGNLPPLFRLSAHTVTFIQNKFLIDGSTLSKFSLLTRLRLHAERVWLNFSLANTDEIIVQTPSMAGLLNTFLNRAIPVKTLPYVCDSTGYLRERPRSLAKNSPECYDFIYLASGEPHKNHRALIEAWRILAADGLFPTLALTIDTTSYPDLFNLLNVSVSKYGLNISNLGWQEHSDAMRLMKLSKAIIYPSRHESFGLPLIEARQAGLPIIASELDYVRDVVDPEESFNPDSPRSIAQAVKRYMKVAEDALPLISSKLFFESIFRRDDL